MVNVFDFLRILVIIFIYKEHWIVFQVLNQNKYMNNIIGKPKLESFKLSFIIVKFENVLNQPITDGLSHVTQPVVKLVVLELEGVAKRSN